MSENPVSEQIRATLKQVLSASLRAGRPVTVVAASKGVWDERLQAAVDLGVTTFGENYAQDFVRKAQSLDYLPVTWHFIGHLQRNKVRLVVGLADLIHSVDSLELAEHIDRVCSKRGTDQKVLLQVNIDGDPNKDGIAPDQLISTAMQMREYRHVLIQGMMVLPMQEDLEMRRKSFRRSRELFEELKEAIGPQVQILSMGMSEDWQVAVEEGATMIRLGTVLFGQRKVSPNF